SSTFLGAKNPVAQHLLVYGDWRSAVAYNDNGEVEQGIVATRLNLDVDWKLTGTERIHAFFRPLDKNGQFTNYVFSGTNDDDGELFLDGNVDALFFEGDFGSIASGLTNKYS